MKIMENNNHNNRKGFDEMKEHDHSQEIDGLWRKSEDNQVIKELRSGKSFEEIIRSIPNIEDVFAENPNSCGCSDGRIHEHRIARAGEGLVIGLEIMLSKSTEEGMDFGVAAVVKFIGEMTERGEIKDKFRFTSHENCGAAGIVCGELKKVGKLPENYNPDQLGIDFAKRVVEALQKAYPTISFEYAHVEADEMDEIHGERAIYLDGTRKINIEATDALPEGFIFTPMPGVSEDETKLELEKLSGIALGDHGFGKRFNQENPFLIIVSTENKEQQKELLEVAESVAAKFNGLVKVEIFPTI